MLSPSIELQSACTLGSIKSRQNCSTLGTGFFVLRDTGEQLSTWLVTARHVVDGRLDLIAKTTVPNGEAFLILPQNKWVFHPGPNPKDLLPIDVAVMKVLVPNDTVSFRYCVARCSNDPKSNAPHMNHLHERPEPTDHALFFGYPSGDVDPHKMPPFVRSGIVAYSVKVPGFRISGLEPADEKLFYVDGLSFGGNSGGPVMLEPTPLSTRVRLWGLVTGSSPNRAYTIVTSVERIKETIEFAESKSPLPENVWFSTPPILEHSCRKN